MELQIGQVYIRITLDIFRKELKLKIVSPVSDHEMEHTEVTIKDDRNCPVKVVTTEYKKGDAYEKEVAKN